MKSKLFVAVCFLILISCEDNSETTFSTYKEVYYRLDTDEKQAEKVFTHDYRGNLVNERYYDLKFSEGGYEIQYTFDDQNRRTELKYIFTDQNLVNSVTYVYADDKLKTEKLFQNSDEVQRSEYFYGSHAKPDSLRQYSILKNVPIYDHTKLFTYDNQERLTEERWNGGFLNNLIIKMNVYSNDLLIESCNPLTHMPEGRNCIKNEYNALGKLSRVYATLTGETDVLLEEYYYEGTLLTSKKVFNQRDGFPAYNADQTIYTILVKYEYPKE